MSEMKEMILDVVERMLQDNVTKDVVDILEDGKWSKDVWALLEENGMVAVAVAEENGGAGGDLEDLLNIVRLTGKYAAPIPFTETTLANFLLEKADLKIVDHVATYHFDTDNLLTLENNALSGTIQNIPWARYASNLVTFVKDGDAIRLAVVDLQTGMIAPSGNLASEPRDTVTFQSVPIQQLSAPLTKEQIYYAKTVETAFKLALMTGAIEKVNALTVQYTKEREQFGRPIHRFQLVQQHIVHLVGEAVIAMAAFNNVCEALQTNQFLHEVAYARIRFEDAITTVATVAHQVHAAIGTTHEHSLHQYTRRLWSWRDEGIRSDFWSEEVANYLLEANEDNLWAYLTKSADYIKI